MYAQDCQEHAQGERCRAGGAEKPEAVTNHRDGSSGKTVLTDDGPVRIDVLRDRESDFEPKLIGKHKWRFTGFDDKIIVMYSRGMNESLRLPVPS